MVTKLFEVRDAGTMIPIFAMRLGCDHVRERLLFARAGFGRTAELQEGYIMVWKMTSGGTPPPRATQATTDPWDWGNRTMTEAHEYIRKNWAILETGAVIDVEYIRGETTEPKRSELW